MSLLVADIGGTNIRFAHIPTTADTLTDIEVVSGCHHKTLLDALSSYIELHNLSSIKEAVIAVAGPVLDDHISVTNSHLQFCQRDLMGRLNLSRLLVINDFTAQALAQTLPSNDERLLLRKGKSETTAPLLVIGPGTGLGISALIPTNDGFFPVEGEGGHISLSPQNQAEQHILHSLQKCYSHVSVERVVSGAGLEYLYQHLTKQSGKPAKYANAAEIGNAAINGDASSIDAVRLMLDFLGTIISDLALVLGARQGIVIVGGIMPKIQSVIPQSLFWDRLTRKGRLSSFITDIPVWLSIDPFSGLKGARHAINNPYLAARIRSA
ncbi:ROK family protein [Candidatus Spongiihabitans sp.]|uniref:glucokinase n=1 Tax=Candidatus Spongiihabitans sp. TaxID=3101308 RepID=UPI003C6EFC7E